MLSVERYEHTVPLFTDADILPLIFFNTNPFFLTHDIRNQKVPSGNILNLYSAILPVFIIMTLGIPRQITFMLRNLPGNPKESFYKRRSLNLQWDTSIIKRAHPLKKKNTSKRNSFFIDILKKRDDYIDVNPKIMKIEVGWFKII